MPRQPRIQIVEGNIAEYPADVIALKYAQGYHGADRFVASLLAQAGEYPGHLSPGSHCLFPGHGVVDADRVLFMGVAPLAQFGYREIREFARRVLTTVAGEAPDTRSVATTLHGPGYGLDETEAFESEVAGFLDAIRSGDHPPELQEVAVIELDPDRCKRLEDLLSDLFPQSEGGSAEPVDIGEAGEDRLRAVGYDSDDKAHVFVAMPFKKEMDDVYHYGIRSAVRTAGFLCERADLTPFTGDVLQWVQQRIKSCTLLIADLSDANPNVYLEVGYAWGCGVPTVLLVRDPESLGFDVRGQRCLVYQRIRDLEDLLRKELRSLGDRSGLDVHPHS